MAKSVTLPTSPNDSLVSPSDGELGSLAKDHVMQEPFASMQTGDHFNKSSLCPPMTPEAFKMADGQGKDGVHFVLQSEAPAPSPEHLKAGSSSSLSAQGEDGSQLVCQGETPEAFSEEPNPAETSEQMMPGEESRPHNCHDTDSNATADSLKQPEPSETPTKRGQAEKGSPCAQYGATSGVWSEQQKSDCTASYSTPLLGVGEERGKTDCQGRTPCVVSEFSDRLEAARDLEEAVCSVGNNQDHIVPESPNLSDSLRHLQQGSCCVAPGHTPPDVSSVECQQTLDTADVNQDLKPGGQEMGEGGKVHGGQERQPIVLGTDLGDRDGPLLEETPVGTSQEGEEFVTTNSEGIVVDPFQALILTGAQSVVGTCCQQRAAGTDGDTFPMAVSPPSPEATGDSLRPAHGGLAPGCEARGREGSDAAESHAASSSSQLLHEAGAIAILESERGEEATRNTGPEETARGPVGAKALASLESTTSTSPEDTSDAMILTRAEESLDTRHKEDSQKLPRTRYLVSTSEQATSNASPGGGLGIHFEQPAHTEVLVDVTDPVCATPTPDQLSVPGGPPCLADWMEDDSGHPENRCPTSETPIEQEIRLHLEREELLRLQRGLTNPRGAQEYVEVRIKPILNQGTPPSPVPKEKERQWAGAQMQREIQRECQREEDLVQLGKVRGAYDRGTQQELQEKKMMFERQAATDLPTPTKMVSGSSEGMRERSFAEADGVAGTVIPAPGALPPPQQPLPERPPTANPFFCLRSKSPQSLLEQEVHEVQERERELRRQRHKVYGSALPQQLEETPELEEAVPFEPERPPCKKLDVTWPPASPAETCQVNGLHQERSPRSRQKSPLIQRWESGIVGNQEGQY